MAEVPTIETERLIMRAWREDDLDAHARMSADPEVMRYIRNGQPLERDEAWRQIALFIGHWELRGYGPWAVQLKVDGGLVGRVGLWQPEGWPGLEVGWTLAREHWGNGYATEAARATCEFARRNLRAEKVISLIQPENQASRRVAERLGMRATRRDALGTEEVLIYEALRA